MNTYLTTMFWLGVLSVIVRSGWLCGEHPRTSRTNVGEEVFGLLLAIGGLGWAAYLKFWT